MIYVLGERRLETADADWFIAPDAQVIGSVRLGSGASVWFGAVLRGDDNWIRIGDGSNVQDGSVIHSDPQFVTELESNVSVGHCVMLHSCHVGTGSLVGNGAIVLEGVRIGRECLIGAGSLIPPGKVIPDRSVIMGSPGKLVREVTPRDLALMQHAAAHYQARQAEYRSKLRTDPRSGRTDGS